MSGRQSWEQRQAGRACEGLRGGVVRDACMIYDSSSAVLHGVYAIVGVLQTNPWCSAYQSISPNDGWSILRTEYASECCARAVMAS